jgi:hypothetical protein
MYSIPERLMRHFFFLHLPRHEIKSIFSILNTLMGRILQRAPNVASLGGAAVQSTVVIFEQCSTTLLPIPSKPHCIFSLRN